MNIFEEQDVISGVDIDKCIVTRVKALLPETSYKVLFTSHELAGIRVYQICDYESFKAIVVAAYNPSMGILETNLNLNRNYLTDKLNMAKAVADHEIMKIAQENAIPVISARQHCRG